MPATNLLTDRSIRAAIRSAAGSEASRKLSDGEGMHLEVRPNGSAWWRFRYRFAGKEGMLSLGVYPDVSLAMARERRDAARKQIASAVDPSAARKDTKAQQAKQAEVAAIVAAGGPLPGTFEAVAREWLTTIHAGKVSEGHAERTRIRLESDAFPHLGSRPIGAIEPPELLAVLRRVVARGAIETAHRLKDICGQVFRYGVASGQCTRNPAADLRDALPPVLSRHHAAIVEPKKAGELLRAMSDYNGHPLTRAALALSALLLLRPGELRQLEWAWVDLEAATITVPSALMKRKKADKLNGAPHLVPLAPQAIAILQEVHPISGAGRFVFPAMYTEDRCMSENTVNVALRRLGFDRQTMTAHGFRAMARTMAAERLGIAPEVIEAQLAHTVGDALGRAYNRTTFADQRRDLMIRWADYVDQLRKGAEVIPFKAA